MPGCHADPLLLPTKPSPPLPTFMAHRLSSSVLSTSFTVPCAPLPRSLIIRYWFTNTLPCRHAVECAGMWGMRVWEGGGGACGGGGGGAAARAHMPMRALSGRPCGASFMAPHCTGQPPGVAVVLDSYPHTWAHCIHTPLIAKAHLEAVDHKAVGLAYIHAASRAWGRRLLWHARGCAHWRTGRGLLWVAMLLLLLCRPLL